MALPKLQDIRKAYVDAALDENAKPRVQASDVQAKVLEILMDDKVDFGLRTFSTGSVGIQVPGIKVVVTNDEGDELALTGSLLLTIKETVKPKES